MGLFAGEKIMENGIQNPKVFISYAWGNKDFQDQVMAFASQLISDGINVILDKWDLSEGNDTYAFMEKCVTDTSITNVLLLLDPIYAKKANEHSGGVGAETQIISAKVYKEVTQDKFIPVVVKRDENGGICKPAYLEGRLHFDLSLPDSYEIEYQRLVRTLYGVKTYEKPVLGKKPNWVDKPTMIPAQASFKYDMLRTNQSETATEECFISQLQLIQDSFIGFINDNSSNRVNGDSYIELYDESEGIRNDYLALIQYCSRFNDGRKSIAAFLESLANIAVQGNQVGHEITRIRAHELFLYTVSFFLKKQKYYDVGYLLGKTYFFNRNNYNNCQPVSFDLFYSGMHHDNLDNAKKKRDGKRYISGTGQHWIDTLASDYSTKKEFVFADLLCFNYSVYVQSFIGTQLWFPITYLYDNEYNSAVAEWGARLVSREFVEDVLPVFGYKSVEELKNKFQLIESESNSRYRNYRYPESFNTPRVFGEFITPDRIASLK